jgi:ABC-type uncharacterized transport system substrate-binding protein
MKGFLFKIIMLVLLVIVIPLSLEAGPVRIFIVHSYEDRHVCGFPQEVGLRKALLDAGLIEGEDVIIRRFMMDTKRTYTTERQIQERGRLALEEIKRFRPMIVVTFDDNAFRTVGLSLVDREDVSVVFSGMNAQPEDYLKFRRYFESRQRPGHNITGVYEKMHIIHGLTVMKEILPRLRKVTAIIDTTPTGDAVVKQIRKELMENDTGVEMDIVRVSTIEEYESVLKKINDDRTVGAIYPIVLSLRSTRDGKIYTHREIFRKTVEISRKPEIPGNFSFSMLGFFGSASVDFEKMGNQAGKKVVAIIRGEKPGNLPIEDAEKYAIVFNLARAKMLGIDIPLDILSSADKVYEEIPVLKGK